MEEMEWEINPEYKTKRLEFMYRHLDVTPLVYGSLGQTIFKIAMMWELSVKNQNHELVLKLTAQEEFLVKKSVSHKEIVSILNTSYMHLETLFVSHVSNDNWRRRILIDVDFTAKATAIIELIRNRGLEHQQPLLN